MKPIVEGRDLVIKVKYGDMLKRFNASVRGNTMDHDMNKLRKKIIDLFKLDPYADVTLSYVDEDGDYVSLDNDDELLDAVITQHLNPLRISVQLKYNIGTASDVKHDVLNSTFARQPQVEQQPLEISSTIDEALKSPSDPLFNGFHKDPLDFFTRALPPILPEFAGTFAKIGFNISQLASNSTGESSGTSGETINKSNNASVPISTPSADPLPVQLQRALSQAAVQFVRMAISTISKVPDNSTGELSGISEKEETKSTHLHPKEETKPSNISASLPTSSFGVPVRRQRQLKSVNLIPGGTGLRKTSFPDLNMDPCDFPIDYDDKSNGVNCRGKSVMPAAPLSMPSQKVDEQSKGGLESISAPRYGNGMEDQKSKMSTNTTMSPANPDFFFQGDASVNHHIGTAVPDLYIPSTLGLHLLGRSRRKHQGYSDRHTFHQGVRCDGCGMYPIIGSRFKSKVKEDYDLCSICFSRMGDEVDYTRIDKAHMLSSHKMFKGSNKLSRRKMYPHLHGTGAKFSRVELESCFVQDVTILDGTMMPPSTPFTKIWRMRNNGSIQWPYGTKLEWIGGYQFSKRLSVQLEIPVEGCQINEEIDIAADFISPPTFGSYISYWRLASPSGQKFGQRVWVLIQVVSSYSFSGNFNLNLPPEGSNADGLRVVDLNAGVPFEPYTVNSSDEFVEAIADHVPVGNSNLEPFDSQLIVGNPNVQPSDNLVQTGNANVETFDNRIPCDIGHPDNKNVVAITVPAESLLSSPLDVPPVVHPLLYPLLDIPLSPLEATVTTDVVLPETETNNAVEPALLKELEGMGFKHIDLNREILRKNDYNLEQSVGDLCGFTEWDLLLDELQEMGFCDRSKNKKLLEKNSGSIKQVVLDLIAEENK